MSTYYAHRFTNALGPMLAIVDEAGALVLLHFGDDVERARRRLQGEWVWSAAHCTAVVEQLDAYARGELRSFDLAVAPRGTPFQLQVWRELQRIPWGTTISYMELARRVRRENAFRAVGQANGANPIAIVVPCHRVIAASGALSGYAGGVSRKRALLQLEGAVAAAEGAQLPLLRA